MARRKMGAATIAMMLLAGCATDSLEGERTVFNNPYVRPVIDTTGIGPGCETARGRDATCLGVPLTRRGDGSSIARPERTSFTRNQRRILRQQAELLKSLSNPPSLPAQPQPLPTAPPIASGAEGADTP
jgi:hypothetical protein